MIKRISQFEQKEISFENFINSLLNKDFVFFDDGQHHDLVTLENQLTIIKSIHGANPTKKIQVATEQYFPKHNQVFVRFNQGEYDAIKELPRFAIDYFTRYTKPILDLCYLLDIPVVPVGDENMVSSGILGILNWNKNIAENLKKFQDGNQLTMPILGSRHLERINNECNSTPEFLRDECYNLGVAVILQSKSAGQCQPLYPSLIPQKNPIEQYSLFGKIK